MTPIPDNWVTQLISFYISYSMPFNFSPHGLLSIPHLRYKRFWLGVGVLGVLAVIYASIATIPVEMKKFLIEDKLMHTVVYACLMGWFAQIYKHDLARLMFVALFIALGVAMELAQGMVPSRQFEYLDMVANTSGVVLAWALAYTGFGGLLEWFETRCLRSQFKT